MISTEEVIWAYRLLLERDPESEEVIKEKQRSPSLHDLVFEFINSDEFRNKSADSCHHDPDQSSLITPKQTTLQQIESKRRIYDNNDSRFWSISSVFDCVDMILGNTVWERNSVPAHIVNFLDVAMNVDFMPDKHLSPGSLDVVPVPANYHADLAEWATMLRAVELAKDRFTCIELGCGWGACLNNTGKVARRRGMEVFLIGVEGDLKHIGYAQEALATNGFSKSDFVLHRGIASANSGYAFFPKHELGEDNWGLEAEFCFEEKYRQALIDSGKYDELPMISLSELIGGRERIDFLHVDIQGAEQVLIHESTEILSRKVAYVFIGTHSREIEGAVMHDFLKAGWKLEIERPLVADIIDGRPVTRIDGVQAWRNPALLP